MKKFSIILLGFLFTIIGLPNVNAESYESYNIGDAVIFNGIGGHVIEDSDASSPTVKIFVDGWNKTKDEWDTYWDNYSTKNGYKNFASLLTSIDKSDFFASLIANKNNYQFEEATMRLLDEFVDIDFIASKYWNDKDNEPVKNGWLSGAENPGLQYVISHDSNVPSWMMIDNINIFGNTLSSNPKRNLCSGGVDGHPDVIYCKINNVGFIDDIYSESRVLTLGNIEYKKASANILGLGHFFNENLMIYSGYAFFETPVQVVVIEKDNIDSVNRTTVVYKKDNSVSPIIKYKNTGIYEDNSECKEVPVNRKINLILNYNNGEESNFKSVEVGSKLDEIPTKEGYEFVGWYYDADFREKFYDEVYAEKVFDEKGCQTGYNDLTLYAKWNKVLSDGDVKLSSYNKLNGISKVSAKKVDDTSKIKDQLNGLASKFIAYDIELFDENNQKVQVQGNVKVSIKIPENFNKEKLVVYYFGEKVQTYNVSVNGDYAEFNASHFSEYVLAEKNDVKNPKTGDNILLYFGFGLTLIMGSLVVVKKLKKVK